MPAHHRTIVQCIQLCPSDRREPRMPCGLSIQNVRLSELHTYKHTHILYSVDYTEKGK